MSDAEILHDNIDGFKDRSKTEKNNLAKLNEALNNAEAGHTAKTH